jgi:hypothetical protein
VLFYDDEKSLTHFARSNSWVQMGAEQCGSAQVSKLRAMALPEI